NTRMSDLGILVQSELVQIDRSATEAKHKAAKFPAARTVKSSKPRAMEAFMRAHHVITVVAVLVIGLGAKQFFFPPVKAEADIPVASMDVLQMTIDHPNRNNHPVQKMHDMTFVYSDSDQPDDMTHRAEKNNVRLPELLAKMPPDAKYLLLVFIEVS